MKIKSVEDFVNMVSTVKPLQKTAILALDHRSGNTGYVELEVEVG
jgi:hypothetical protein